MKLFAVILMLLWSGLVSAENAQVIEGVRAKLRSGDGENYRTLRVLPSKSVVEVIEQGDEFSKVKSQDGQYGWIKSSLLQPLPLQSGAAKVLATPAQASVQVSAAAPMEAVKAPVTPVEAAQKDLLEAREQLIKMQKELEKERARTDGEPQFSTLLLSALAAFVAGMALGAFLLHTYYLKRLRGLRI